MFAPRTYWRLFELANAEAWPLPPALAGMAALAWWWAARRGPRAPAAAFAAAWALVAGFFLWRRYVPINWAAEGLAWLFAAQAVALLVWSWRPAVVRAPSLRRRAGHALLAAGVVLYPLLAPLQGRPWRQAEWFGIAPDPTVVATLGLLLLRPPRGMARALWAAPVAAAAASAATLWTMGSAQGAAPAAALLIALAVGLGPGPRGGPAGCPAER